MSNKASATLTLMIGIEIAMLAATPQADAQAKLSLAAEACRLWVIKDADKDYTAKRFLEETGLHESGLAVTEAQPESSPFSSSAPEAFHLKIGDDNRFIISLVKSEDICSFQASGSDEFQTALQETIINDGLEPAWKESGRFMGHRMYAIVCFRSTETPQTKLMLKSWYYRMAGDEPYVWGEVARSDEEETPSPLGLLAGC